MPTYATDRESLERDCELEFFVAGGPGGQHRNKTESAVRLTHRPSGIVVTATPDVWFLKDTDGDGLPEFVDAWGEPLRFYRWPIYYSPSSTTASSASRSSVSKRPARKAAACSRVQP